MKNATPLTEDIAVITPNRLLVQALVEPLRFRASSEVEPDASRQRDTESGAALTVRFAGQYIAGRPRLPIPANTVSVANVMAP